MPGADHDRRPRDGTRPGVEERLADVLSPAQCPDGLQVGLHLREPAVEVPAERLVVAPGRAGADADGEPAAGELLQGEEALGQLDRVAQRDDEDRGAHLDPLVAAAATSSHMSGSGRVMPGEKLSPSQMPSNPSRSMSWARRCDAGGVERRAAAVEQRHVQCEAHGMRTSLVGTGSPDHSDRGGLRDELDLGAVLGGHPGEPLDDHGGGLVAGEQRQAGAVPPRRAEAEVDRVQPDLGEAAAAELHLGHRALQADRVLREAAPGPGVPDPVGVAGGGRGRQPEPLGEVPRLLRDRLVLDDEVAERVEDRLALVELDAAIQVRAVAEHDVGPRVDGPVGEFDGEVRRVLAGGARLVAVHRDDHPVRELARLGDPAEVELQVERVDPPDGPVRGAEGEGPAEEGHGVAVAAEVAPEAGAGPALRPAPSSSSDWKASGGTSCETVCRSTFAPGRALTAPRASPARWSPGGMVRVTATIATVPRAVGR